jgi:antitoxin component of MazEF toxin-antitoxin module
MTTPPSWDIRVYMQLEKIVKIRRVGNSNVISIPREFEAIGFTKDVSVVVTALPSGELRVFPADQVRHTIREVGRKVISKDRHSLQILEGHDKGRD